MATLEDENRLVIAIARCRPVDLTHKGQRKRVHPMLINRDAFIGYAQLLCRFSDSGYAVGLNLADISEVQLV